MNRSGHDDLSHLSMLELFRVEAEGQTAALTAGLLELERVNGPAAGDQRPEASGALLESLMRAAHSLKGAARIVNLGVAVRVAHTLEDCFVAAQRGVLRIGQREIDTLLRGVDLLLQISQCNEAGLTAWEGAHVGEVEGFIGAVRAVVQGQGAAGNSQKTEAGSQKPEVEPLPAALRPLSSVESEVGARNSELGAPGGERVVRLNAENLNRLLGLAGESLVETRWLRPFTEGMQRLKRMQSELEVALGGLRRELSAEVLGEGAAGRLNELMERSGAAREFLARRLEELDVYDRRSAHLSNRLYLEVLRTRMRPFGEGTQRFPRMVRDLAHSLGKQVRLEVLGEHTQVDRDILEQLETPLAHLLRNAVDHGCETPEVRVAAGKAPEGVIQLEARHSAGMLLVTVADDGRGVDVERVRAVIVERGLTSGAVAERMTEGELLEFLFLPGFTLKNTVTEVSGRGVGLDVVQNLVKSVRGTVRVATVAGRGMKFQLQLPLTLSVVRTLLVAVGGEPYAIPLGQITQALKLDRARIETLAGRAHFAFGDQRVGLLRADQVFGGALGNRESGPSAEVRRQKSEVSLASSDFRALAAVDSELGNRDSLSVVVLGERQGRFGLVVDRFLGERELVVQPLDPRLGKVPDISAAALLEDGSPVLIVDVDDLLCSIEQLVASGAVLQVPGVKGQMTGDLNSDSPPLARKRKRVLAVDDSLTVRELERKLLLSRGYLADVAVDGMDGWNAVRTGVYDLVITDVDMPRMDGIELATLIKQDAKLKSLPVMIVSYKDREVDRMRGLEAGADYYLTKGSFHDETLLQAVLDLIGEPEA
jgi:two-component system sensor histidine kinase and response regulator WspE